MKPFGHKLEDMTEGNPKKGLSVKDIFDQNPKAKERFKMSLVKLFSKIVGSEDIDYPLNILFEDPLESQIGYLMSWWRSEGYRHFSFQNFPHKGFSKFGMYKINKYTPDSIEQTGKDFNTAFLALLKAYCEQ